MADWSRVSIAVILAALFVSSGPPEALCAPGSPPAPDDTRFDSLVAKLGGGGTEALMAAAALGDLGDRRAVPHLLPMAREGQYSFRLTAIEALGVLGDTRATATVMGALGAADRRMRATSAEALGLIGDRSATRGVADLLGDESERVRLSAAEALGALRDPVAVGPLVRVLGDESSRMRIAVARALGAIGRRGAEVPLAGLLRDKVPSVRRSALAAIRLFGPHRPAKSPGPIDRWAPMIEDRYPEVRAYAVRKLGQSGSPKAEAILIGALNDRDVAVFFPASLWLGRLGGAEGVSALIATLETTASPQRWTSAAAALAERKDKRAIGPLLRHMTSRRFDVDIAEAGLVALGGIGDKSALAPIRKLQETSGKIRLCRATLIGVLARLGDAASWSAVLAAAGASDSASRRQGALWLGYTQSPRAVAPLTGLLSDADVSVRVMAATGLGNMRRGGQAAAGAALAKALKDKDKTVRQAAAAALERIRPATKGGAVTAPGGRN